MMNREMICLISKCISIAVVSVVVAIASNDRDYNTKATS